MRVKKQNIILLASLGALAGLLLTYYNADISADSKGKPVNISKKRPSIKVCVKTGGRTASVFIPENIKALFDGWDSSDDNLSERKRKRKAYLRRLKVLQYLGRSLSKGERDALYLFLKSDENDRLTLHVKDEIMCLLETQQTLPSEFIDSLIAISQIQDLDGDLRGYTIQHLRRAYEKGKNLPESDKFKIREALYKAIDDRATPVAGTAILALADLSQNNEDFDFEMICQNTAKLAADDSMHIPSRITAVRLCGTLNLENSLKTVRKVADTANDKTLRLAAVAALGDIGNDDDIGTLYKIKKIKLYKKAAELSLSKIEQRQNGNRSAL